MYHLKNTENLFLFMQWCNDIEILIAQYIKVAHPSINKKGFSLKVKSGNLNNK